MNGRAVLPRQLVGAGVAAFDPHGRLLLIRRRDNGLWDIPGGRVEPGESVEAAAAREFHEEVGIVAGQLELLRVFSGPDFLHRYPDGNEVAWVTVLFRTQGPAVDPAAGDDAADARWFGRDALPETVGLATRRYLEVLFPGRGAP